MEALESVCLYVPLKSRIGKEKMKQVFKKRRGKVIPNFQNSHFRKLTHT
jgi:hypothetical protein